MGADNTGIRTVSNYDKVSQIDATYCTKDTINANSKNLNMHKTPVYFNFILYTYTPSLSVNFSKACNLTASFFPMITGSTSLTISCGIKYTYAAGLFS